MAEIKFNFYNLYNNYYRDMNDFKTLIIYIEPKYEIHQEGYLYMEIFTKFFFNKFESYISFEKRVGLRIDYIVYKSLKVKNREKVFLIKIFNLIYYDYKIYNLFKY